MNELQIFENKNFGKIRATVIEEKPYFNLKDVCEILGLENPSDVKRRLNQKGVVLTDTPTNGGKQKMNYIDEMNFYKCVFKSDKKEAEQITDWVAGEVLPTIRKTGMYMTDNVWERLIQNPEQFGKMIIEYAQVRKENDSLKLENKVQAQQIIELQPKATYYDLILQNPNLLTTRLIASDYGMTANEFNKMLHNFGVQYKQSGIWFLYKEYSKYGYTQTKTQPIVRSDGTPDNVPHMYWTQKGRMFLYDFLKNRGIVPIIEQEEKGA